LTQTLQAKFPKKLEFLFDHHDYKISYGGRGGSKSWAYARALILRAAEKKIRILCTREVQKSIKDSVHKLISDQIELLGLGSQFTILQNEIRGKNGSEFIFTGLSTQTVESVKSYEKIGIVWAEEAHKISRRSWDVLLPTIREPGAEIWISLNPELDTDETYVRFIENPPIGAFVQEINHRDNPWFPEFLEKQRKELLRQVGLGLRTQDDYDNIWEGKCKAAVEGAIYHKEILAVKSEGRLTRVPYDPMLKVHCIYDLGWNDATCILMAQKSAGEIRIIDYIEDTHRTIDDYVLSTSGREDLATRNYNWGKDYLPHDGRARSVLSDKSAQDILKALGRDVEITPDIGIEPGINAARMMFPKVVFDKEKCTPLFNRLGRYKRMINQATNEPGAPLHDENCHGADGFRYLGVVVDKLRNDKLVISDPYKGLR